MSGRDDDNVPVDTDGQDDQIRRAHNDNIPSGHELAYDPPGTDEWADERKKEHEQHSHQQKPQDDEDQGGGNAGGCRVDGTGCPRY